MKVLIKKRKNSQVQLKAVDDIHFVIPDGSFTVIVGHPDAVNQPLYE